MLHAAFAKRKKHTQDIAVRTSFNSIIGLELHDHIRRRDYGCFFLSFPLLGPPVLRGQHYSLPTGQLPTRRQLCYGSFAPAQAKSPVDVLKAVGETAQLTR